MDQTTTRTASDPVPEVIDKLRAWIISHRQGLAHVDEDTDIIENRLIDSLQFVTFVLFIEELRGRVLSADETKLENFRTLRIMGERLFASVPAPAAEGRWSWAGKR